MKSDVELATFLLNSHNRVQNEKTDTSHLHIQRHRKNFRNYLFWIFQDLENNITTFFKKELDRFKKILKKENTKYFVKDFKEARCTVREAVLDITLYFLRSMKQDELAGTLEDELVFIHQRQIKSNLKKRYQCLSEGISKQGESTSLNKIYTDLYVTSEQVNTDNELMQIVLASRHRELPEEQVKYTNLFEQAEEDQRIRTVLTKGVAGIGKSVSVQKFILDWAEGTANQDITFIFPLPFREINLQEKERLSLMDLVRQFFPETKGLNLARNEKFKILFVLDGLDECRLPLKFTANEICRDVTLKVPLDVLLTNLINGNLFSSALIWITTRPAAASKIPNECIHRVTEVRGFDDVQKKEYFRKRFPDTTLADEIIKHVVENKSLFIMCYIPVFCWISATVLQNILEERLQVSDTDDMPKTLTQMYTHFFRFQIQQSGRKYEGQYGPDISWNTVAISSLGKLAFHQLQRNNLIFNDTDLESCGIDLSNASAYSGMCTQIFKEETGIRLGTTYCFVHMSIQEFTASLYAHLFLDYSLKNVFAEEQMEQENETMYGLLKTAVDKALESDNGHLDLFLRFLLGLSLKSNRPLLRGLLTQRDSNEEIREEIVKYIKQKLDSNLSPERSINLFYCLNELNDRSLVNDIQEQLNKGSLSSVDLSPAQWSALAYVLVTSNEEREVFELQKFKKSDDCLCRLELVVINSKRALLNDCNLTEKGCLTLAKVLESDTSLQELNIDNNNLQDSGVESLCTGLVKTKKSKLEILRLSSCNVKEKSCSALASVLGSDSSGLRDLDLSNNLLQDSGVTLLSAGLQENSTLEILKLSKCSITEGGYKSLASALESNPSHLKELDLTGNDPGESGVKLLTDVQQQSECTLTTLRFLSPAAEKALEYLTEVLGENLLFLRKLDLSKHTLRPSGMVALAPVLKDKHCKLQTFILNYNFREEDCAALATAFNSNPTNLEELDLSGSTLRDSGMRSISTLFENSQCRLIILKLNHIDITKEGCVPLALAFNSNPSHLRELDLSGNKIEDFGVTEISTLLKNSECRLEKLRLSNCSITEGGYKSLASALESNPSHLKELDLTGNDPGESGVKLLTVVPNCALKTLRLLKSPEAEEACQYLTGVVGTNPLILRELNLSKHKLDDTKVMQLAALL
ncbi:protein NLRC3-like isoform X2 [Triplophysa rosa]|uniref:protein NLRC3-like isoform X2 n=1 Tax=Triplophysa rosa TaxID=992332 RepID=UPI002546108D|nr:protein NLRC3-like isoform X2 [Triplophysa rosa]